MAISYEQQIINAIELRKAKTYEAERRYAKLPKQKIKDLNIQDYQDYTNWKQLPRLITV